MIQVALRGKGLVMGVTEGKALVSRRAFTFAHGVDPSTGRVTDIRSDIRGATVKGKVLFYPFGKGLTTGSSWFLETVRLGNQPLAIVTEGVDLSAVVGSVLANLIYGKGIPVIAGVSISSCARVTSGIEVSLDANTGEVRVED